VKPWFKQRKALVGQGIVPAGITRHSDSYNCALCGCRQSADEQLRACIAAPIVTIGEVN
jgi:hypothetical protein